MLHSAETIDLTFADGLVSKTTRIAVPGGWIYSGATAVFVPDPAAPHVRDDRRLKLREGFDIETDIEKRVEYYVRESDDIALIYYTFATGLFTAWRDDKSITEHASLLEAHDALVESGSDSPFVTLTGPAKTEPSAVYAWPDVVTEPDDIY